MARYTCTDCHQPIATGSAVLRGNGHELLAWHRDCYTLHRALSGAVIETLTTQAAQRA